MTSTSNDDQPFDVRVRIVEAGHHVLVDQMASVVVSLQDMQRTMQANGARMSTMESELKDNTATTGEVRDILSAAKGAFKFFSVVGIGMKWLAGLAGAISSLYVAWLIIKNGGKPPGV